MLTITGKDLVFLRDYIEFGYLQHLVAALAFYHAAANSTDVGAKAHEILECLNPTEAAERVRNLNTGARIQTVALSRLYAERAATYEDFGALLYAIRNRAKKSFFVGYLESSGAEVAQFYDNVLATDYKTLDQILLIPSLEILKEHLDHETFKQVSNEYVEFSKDIKGIAEEYRCKDDVALLRVQKDLQTDWKEQIYLALELVPDSATSSSTTKPLMTEAYNKIKHRFTVIEMIDSFIQADPINNTLRCAIQSRKPEWADKMLCSIAGVITRAMEISAIVYDLANMGLI